MFIFDKPVVTQTPNGGILNACKEISAIGGSFGMCLGFALGLCSYLSRIEKSSNRRVDNSLAGTLVDIGEEASLFALYTIGGPFVGMVAGATFPISAPAFYLTSRWMGRKKNQQND